MSKNVPATIPTYMNICRRCIKSEVAHSVVQWSHIA
jgi:hypothetical protein